MGWDDSEEGHKKRQNNGKFFKLEDDGARARVVVLTEPEEEEIQGGVNGTWVAYTVELWNVEHNKRQSWGMGSRAFKSLCGLKNAIGKAKLHGSELIVVRSGRKGDTETTYTWVADGPVTADARMAIELEQRATGNRWVGAGTPASTSARTEGPPAPKPARTDLDGGLKLATSVDELASAFRTAWADCGEDAATQAHLQALYNQCKTALQAAKPRQAPAF